jgi:hypothetical protein
MQRECVPMKRRAMIAALLSFGAGATALPVRA